MDPSRISAFILSVTKNQDEKSRKYPFIYEEKILISYNLFITKIIRYNLKDKLDYDNVRSIFLKLTYQNLFSINKFIFELIEELFGNNFKGFFMFLFGEYNSNDKKEPVVEGNELIQLVKFQFLKAKINI